MTRNEWIISFDIAGVFVPDKDIQLTPKVLVKKSQKEEPVLDKYEPVHQALVTLTSEEFKTSDKYDIKNFGTNKFDEESEFGVAEKNLFLAP